MSAVIDAIGGIINAVGSAITAISKALGIKDLLDNLFRGSEIVNASASFSRLFSIKLSTPIVRQTVISALLGDRNPVKDLMHTIQKTPARNFEKAYQYAVSQQSSETYAFSASYIAARDAYSQATINYTNSVNTIKDDAVFTVVNHNGDILRTYSGYANLLNALNASDVDTKFPTLTEEILPRTHPKTYTYIYQKQNALNVLAQVDNQINAMPKPAFNPPTQLGYYYYRLPTIESSGFITNSSIFMSNGSVINNVEGYPIIVIKREGGYSEVNSDEYNSTKKLCKLYGFDYDSLKSSVVGIDNPDLKAAGVILGVDIFSNTKVAKEYVAEFFNTIVPYGTISPIQEITQEVTESLFGGEGGGIPYDVATSINPYIKVSESSINLLVTCVNATKSIVSTSDVNFLNQLYINPTVNVVRTDDNGKYNISIYRYIDTFNYLSIYIEGFTLQTYVATDTSYHGTEIGMYTFNAPVAVATDHTDPLILPLLRVPYLHLSTLDRIDLSRETGFLIAMSAQVVALTWAQEHAAFLQIIMIVLAVVTMGESLALVGTMETTTAAGLVTTAAAYSMSAFIVNLAINVVIVLAVKELATRLFPDNEIVQTAATVVAMYYVSDVNFSGSDGLEDILNNRSLIDNVLKYSQAVIDVYNTGIQEKNKKDSKEYSTELDKLKEEYEVHAAELEAMPQLTDLIREDYRNSVLLRNRVKPLETVDMFYARTLNTNFAEATTNSTYYYDSKLNLNNIT
jgi:hypothetical protein